MGFQIANDANGTPMLWEGSHWQARPVINRDELSRASDPYGDLLWQVLTAVLAPDEATVERLAQAMVGEGTFFAIDQADRWGIRQQIRAVLAALAGTSAQARHTADNATGGA